MNPIADAAAPQCPKHLLTVAALMRVAAQPCLSFEERLVALTDAACILRLVDPGDAQLFWQTIEYGKAHEPGGLQGFEFVFNQLRRLASAEEETA